MYDGQKTPEACNCKEPEHTFTTYDSSMGETKVRDDYQVAFCRSPCRASGEEFIADVLVWGKPRGGEDRINRRPRMRVRVYGRSKNEVHAAMVAIMHTLESRFADE